MKNDTEVALRLPHPALCQLDYHYCKASDLLADTTNTSNTSGGSNHRVMKRKLRDFVDSYREEEFYLERPAPKRVSPFLNTPKQRKDERKRIVRLSVHKLRAMEDPENFLRKSVLINNVLRRLHQEIREEKRGNTRFSGSLGLASAGYPYYRPRRIDYDMLGNSYLPTPAAFLFDEPCFPTETEKITDDMTDSLVRSLEASTPPPSPPSSPAAVNHLTTTTTAAVTGVNITTTSLVTPITATTTSTTTTTGSSSSTTTTNNTSIISTTTTTTTVTTSTATPTNNTATTTTTTTTGATNTTSSNSLPGNVSSNNHICSSSSGSNGSSNLCVNNTNTNNDNNNNYNIINFNTYNNNNNNSIHHNNFSTSNFLTSSHVGFTSFATTPPTGLPDYRNTGITSAGITVQEKQLSVDMDVVFNNLIRALGET
ncbi:cell wall protein DAN4 [Octopus sinensis]|uniref:Cell wall protein DAN4 n=1 Tax=Octopus sinensis TaxID=2607531 RepID=A0A6P7SJG5_9MOLL|nr:cell wall protein DAN4 [Octopus sinensis]